MIHWTLPTSLLHSLQRLLAALIDGTTQLNTVTQWITHELKYHVQGQGCCCLVCYYHWSSYCQQEEYSHQPVLSSICTGPASSQVRDHGLWCQVREENNAGMGSDIGDWYYPPGATPDGFTLATTSSLPYQSLECTNTILDCWGLVAWPTTRVLRDVPLLSPVDWTDMLTTLQCILTVCSIATVSHKGKYLIISVILLTL